MLVILCAGALPYGDRRFQGRPGEFFGVYPRGESHEDKNARRSYERGKYICKGNDLSLILCRLWLVYGIRSDEQ